MEVKATIEKIYQHSTTTEPNRYRLSVEAIGAPSQCDELMEWIKKFGDKKQMKSYKSWEREKQLNMCTQVLRQTNNKTKI